jgi:GNAT superfamily N-acetyltransferase
LHESVDVFAAIVAEGHSAVVTLNADADDGIMVAYLLVHKHADPSLPAPLNAYQSVKDGNTSSSSVDSSLATDMHAPAAPHASSMARAESDIRASPDAHSAGCIGDSPSASDCPPPRTYFIHDLLVAPAHRSGGVAARLVRARLDALLGSAATSEDPAVATNNGMISFDRGVEKNIAVISVDRGVEKHIAATSEDPVVATNNGTDQHGTPVVGTSVPADGSVCATGANTFLHSNDAHISSGRGSGDAVAIACVSLPSAVRFWRRAGFVDDAAHDDDDHDNAAAGGGCGDESRSGARVSSERSIALHAALSSYPPGSRFMRLAH